MLNILISLLTFVLILVSLFMVLVILMQRANTNSGMGSAFGGGVAESAFGAETTNVLVKATKWSAAAFFVIALVLFLMHLSRSHEAQMSGGESLPDIPVAQQTLPQQPVEEAPVIDAEAAMQSAADAAEDSQQAVDAFTGEPVDNAPVEEAPPQP